VYIYIYIYIHITVNLLHIPVDLLETCKIPQFYLNSCREDKHSNKCPGSRANRKLFSVQKHINRHIVHVLGRSASESEQTYETSTNVAVCYCFESFGVVCNNS